MTLPKLSAPAKVGLATYNRDAEHKREGTSTTLWDAYQSTLSGCRQGPTRPTPPDLTHTSELLPAWRAEARAYTHAQNKNETTRTIEDIIGPKPDGR